MSETVSRDVEASEVKKAVVYVRETPCGQKTQPWAMAYERLGSNDDQWRKVGPWVWNLCLKMGANRRIIVSFQRWARGNFESFARGK